MATGPRTAPFFSPLSGRAIEYKEARAARAFVFIRHRRAVRAFAADMKRSIALLASGSLLLAASALAGCRDPLGLEDYRDSGKVLTEAERSSAGAESRTLGVNAYLWRAALETVSFMPLASSDPFGGVIITDWYAPPETPGERFKMDVYILGASFSANSVRVAVFRQTRDAGGAWLDAEVSSDTAHRLENKILERAYQIRQTSQPAEG